MSNGAPGKPKPAFFVAVFVVVAGLIALAYMRCRSTDKKTDEVVDGSGSGGKSGSGSGAKPDGKQVEATGPVTGLTAKNYEYEPATTLPPVPGEGAYKKLDANRTVKFAVNTWAGWAPIVWANGGHKPGKKWKDGKGGEFQVELILSDDPVTMVNVYSAGDTHIGWATVDMLPLIVGRLKDPRTMPRVYQQIDWSNGGDGIVVRKDIKEIGDLKGKTVALAQNTPSHYFFLNALKTGGVKPSEVTMRFTKDAFQAAAAFNNDKSISGCVSWSPDIYTLTDNPSSGNKLLLSTGTANKLIADVWFARADFARDYPEIIEGLVTGILDAVQDLQEDRNKQAVGPLMDAFYKLDAGTGVKMLADAHWTNYAENRDFFLVATNPTNFERTYDSAVDAYKRAITHDIKFDAIMDFSVIKKLGKEPRFASQKNTYEFKFTPTSAKDINVESTIAKRAITVSFFPNSYDIFKKVAAKNGDGEVYYDGNILYTLDDIAKTAGQYGAARIVISGHTDASMKSQGADPNLVKELSENRAKAVKEGLLAKYKSLNPDQIVAQGYGWDRPADPNDPDNHVKNRRVEVRVVPAESQ